MSTAPAFQTADKLSEPCSVSDEIAKALRVRDEAILKLTNPTEQTQDVNPTFKQSGANIRPEEKQALVQLLSDLGEQGKSQAKQIKGLQTVTKDQAEQIGLLRDGIVRLQNEVASCVQFQGRIAEDLARGLQRITALENQEKDSETNNKRAAKIKEYLAENGTPGKFLDKRTRKLVEGRAVRFELLRSYLEIDKWQLNRALRTLINMYPGEYCKKKLNKTTWILVERPKL